jgi:putative nucleotidyltransferase with HDIG domain
MFRLLQRLKRLVRAKLKVARTGSNWAAVSPKWGFKIAILILVTILIVRIYPIRYTYIPISTLREGDIATEDIIAPMDYPVEKSPEMLQDEIDEVKTQIALLLDFNEFVYDSVLAGVDSLFSSALAMRADGSDLDNQSRRLRLFFPQFDQRTLSGLLSLDSLHIHRVAVQNALEDIYRAGVLRSEVDIRNMDYENVAIVRSNVRNPLKRDQIVTMNEIEGAAARSLVHSDSTLSGLLATVLTGFVSPTLTVNYAQTEREKTLAVARIPREEISFRAGDMILRRNHKVEAVHLEWLDALAEHRAETEEQASLWQFILPVLGRTAFVGFTLAVFVLFLYYFKRRDAFSNVQFTAMMVLILVQVVLNYLIGFKLNISFYLIPFAISSMMFAILFDLEVGLMATFILGVLAGLLNNFDFSHTFANVAVGSIACFSVRVVRRRSDFYRSILYVSVTYLVLILLLEFLRFTEPEQILVEFGYGILNAVLCPILVMGFLPFFESIFNLTTDITLLEMSDMNHPLLRRLAIEAPGTYHHSIIVGNLSEKAAEAIGANPLLARVGSYYHDIGKMEISEYFVENQSGIRNKHEKLNPNMSALIIASHVKKGVELAEDYDLPDRILDFIDEHHGTTLISFFYAKAKEQSGDSEFNEDDFRYPGPRPNSRETAIMMLADSVEAASRTLEEPKPSRIQHLIKRIINDKFQGGQLASSELTMHDLSLIEDSFANMLIGVFHARIDYPKKEMAE